MKNKPLIAALALCALLALAGFTYRADALKWEYEIVTFTVTADNKADAKLLNSDGGEGWDLVAVERDGSRRSYFFKRPVR